MTVMGIASSAAGVVTATPSGPSGPGDDPRFGMAMRFSVMLRAGSGTMSLGSWSACSGLAMTLKPEEFRRGGNYEHLDFLPGDVTYPQITLERAIEKSESQQVQNWLRSVVNDWINADEGGSTENPVGRTVVITLYGAADRTAVQTWELRNAIPVSWTGPNLNATANQIATERLVLAHEGFSASSKGPGKQVGESAGPNPSRYKLKIELATNPSECVEFVYTPTQVVLDKTVNFSNRQTVHGSVDQLLTTSGNLVIRCGELRIEGKSAVKADVDQLFNWLEAAPESPGSVKPVAGPASSKWTPGKTPDRSRKKSAPTAGASKQPSEKSVKKLRLTLGTDPERLSRLVVIKTVNVTYTRFTKDGAPSRAKVTLGFEATFEPVKGTNPTSGTPEPSQVRTVVAGDSMPSIAQNVYGDPGQWREVAEANGIDDPLRLRTGRVLGLPGVG